MSTFVAFAPAKINLFLAITERRPDQFHNLVSLAAPLQFGDTLWFAEEKASIAGRSGFRLECDDPSVPGDDSNLILKAAQAFAAATSWTSGGVFTLTKRIPMGAGLGGGSSDASAALLLLNAAAGHPLDATALHGLATQLGSDCALFIAGRPLLMRGRGELLESLSASAAARISGRRVLVFKPWFGISTPWAYKQLAAGAPASYLPPHVAEDRVRSWQMDETATLESVLYNNMEEAAFRKFVAMPALLSLIRDRLGLEARMSGSGSACFALLPEGFDARPLCDTIREAWGQEVFLIETRFA